MIDFIVWLTGHRPGNRYRSYNADEQGCVKFSTYPDHLWICMFTGHPDTYISIPSAPCFIHRWMQLLVLGIRYKRIHHDR